MSSDLPVLPERWAYAPLDQCCLDDSITYGVVQPGTAVADGKPIIRVNNFRGSRIDVSDVLRIAPEIEAKYRRTRLRGGEVLLTVVGSVGQVAVAPPDVAGFNVARAVAVIHPRPGIAADWIALCLASPLAQHLLGSRANTTVQTTINLKELRSLPIPLPSPEERRAIVDLVGAIDNRLALLRDTNSTLESIAQALFKSWFVDFDPVRAKMDGRTIEGLDEATAALFPSRFENSERCIPKGWRQSSLLDVCSYLNRGLSPKYVEATGVLVLNQKCIRDFSVDYAKGRRHDAAQRRVDGRFLATGDVLVNSTGVGTLGRVAQVLELPEPAIVDSHVTVVRSKPSVPWTYLGQWICRMQPEIEAMGEGSTGQTELSRSKLGALQILLPTAPLLDAFDSVVKPLKMQVSLNEKKIRTLTDLRDTLLPRLISGKLRLPETALPEITP